MQRREAKSGLRDRKGSLETERAQRYRRKIPTETAYPESAYGFAVSWDWMVVCRSQIRTWSSTLNSLITAVLQGIVAKQLPVLRIWS